MKTPKFVFNYNFLPFPIFFLFKWIPDQSPLLNALLVCLKHPGTNLFHREFAELLAFERGFIERSLFVSVPPTETGDKDHAYVLASQIAAIYRAIHETPLRWQDKAGKQREKGKKERAKAKMIKQPNFKKSFKNQKVILVDDIVTTGETARKAYEALGKPKDFELWCLACRQPGSLI